VFTPDRPTGNIIEHEFNPSLCGVRLTSRSYTGEELMTFGKKPPHAVTLSACAAAMLGAGAAAAVSLCWDNGRILMSENGGPFREIRVGENKDADRLRALLAESGSSTTIPVAPTLVADGGQSPSWPTKDERATPLKDKGTSPHKTKHTERPKTG
jgi:hypothetical protein